MRVKFLDKHGQRKFLKEVLLRVNCPSLYAFEQFGFEIPYSTMKNYYSEKRLMSKELFNDLCYLAKIDSENLNIAYLEDNWGKSKGGKKSRR
jgi:hypothetical protein